MVELMDMHWGDRSNGVYLGGIAEGYSFKITYTLDHPFGVNTSEEYTLSVQLFEFHFHKHCNFSIRNSY